MNNSEVKVSVIMPIYNAYDYLRLAIDSVLGQTLREIELICIDDGSTDHSLDILKEYQKADSRVRIVTENNAGPAIARNKGIVRARGEFVIFLDADDFFEPTLIERLYERAVADSLDIAVVRFDFYNNNNMEFITHVDEGHTEVFNDGAVVSRSRFPHYILSSTSGYVWNKLFRTSFVREKELSFAPELYVFEDVYFVCIALSLAERVGRVDEILIHHRIYSNQARVKRLKKYYNHVPKVYLKIKEFLMQHGVYVPLMRSYLNVSATRCYDVYNLLSLDARSKYWNLLHDGYADRLGWFCFEQSDFESETVCDFVANVGLYTHDQYRKRIAKGRHLNLVGMDSDGLTRKIKVRNKNMRKRERLKLFFMKLFRIKPKKTEDDAPQAFTKK